MCRGYDPALSVDAAWRLPSQVKKMNELKPLLADSDFITVHVPAIPQTQHLMNSEMLQVMKQGAILLNFARESIVDAKAVVSSLTQGHLGQYITDFPEPCLIGVDGVLAMPHIGASTQESEENCAVMAANQLKDFIEHGNIYNSVNYPQIFMERKAGVRMTFSNDNVAGALSEVLKILAKHKLNVIDLVNKSRGNLAYNIIDLESHPSKEALEDIQKLTPVIRIRILD